MAKTHKPRPSAQAKQRALIKHLRTHGSISAACEAVGCHRRTHYRWMESYESYRLDVEDALADFVDTLEQEIDRRAFHGVEEPVFFKDQQVGTIRKFSDQLAMFRLRALAPDRYCDRRQSIVQADVRHTGQIVLYMPHNGREPGQICAGK